MTAGGFFSQLTVISRPGQNRQLGHLFAGGVMMPCALGRAGVVTAKHEGDGGTPRGVFGLAGVLYRPDRGPRPRCGLPVAAIEKNAGWCDDPADPAYNQPVDLPYPAGAEHLWRNDRLYDLVVVIDYNLNPARRAAGSAIFLHLATTDFSPTAGCIAVSLAIMHRLLPRLGAETVINIR